MIAATTLTLSLAACSDSSEHCVQTDCHLPVIAVVLSYDDSYPWQQDIKEGIIESLDGHAKFHFYSMNTLGLKATEDIEQRGKDALEWAAELSPDAIIVADDNAMKYVALAEEHAHTTPVIFCGVNWPADSYDLPQPNLSGMVEISPVQYVLDILEGVLNKGDHVVILGADRPTDRAQARGFIEVAEQAGLNATSLLVSDYKQWEQAFLESQDNATLVYALNNAGIQGWDHKRAVELAQRNTKVITVSEYAWMAPYVLVSATKRGQEQGTWAALEALRLTQANNSPPGPLMVNREVEYAINHSIRESAEITLPRILHLYSETK